jgi:hypothetical protein
MKKIIQHWNKAVGAYRLNKLIASAAETDGLSQSEYFGLRREGYNPLSKAEARTRLERDGGKANVRRIKNDGVFIFVEDVQIRPT